MFFDSFSLVSACIILQFFCRFEWSIWLAKELQSKAHSDLDTIVSIHLILGEYWKQILKIFCAWYLIKASYVVFEVSILRTSCSATNMYWVKWFDVCRSVTVKMMLIADDSYSLFILEKNLIVQHAKRHVIIVWRWKVSLRRMSQRLQSNWFVMIITFALLIFWKMSVTVYFDSCHL